MLRFGIKVGLAAGAVNYVSEQGVWKDTDESLKTYNKLKSSLAPYTKELSAKMPFEIPQLPKENKISYVIKQYWNKGVMCTFQFLIDIPDYARYYTWKGYNAALENPEVKKFFESFSKPPERIESKK